jgi:hypothetical protein
MTKELIGVGLIEIKRKSLDIVKSHIRHHKSWFNDVRVIPHKNLCLVSFICYGTGCMDYYFLETLAKKLKDEGHKFCLSVNEYQETCDGGFMLDDETELGDD